MQKMYDLHTGKIQIQPANSFIHQEVNYVPVIMLFYISLNSMCVCVREAYTFTVFAPLYLAT